MDNPLTPNKIQRLMHLAEDRSFNVSRRMLLNDEKTMHSSQQPVLSKSTINCESSSGILDLDRVETFGESILGNMSLSKSTAFNPGEMTGRSTGADDYAQNSLGRHSLALDSITSQMDKQTSEIHDIMRHSIATNYSFHSKRDLTADEASLLQREGALPIAQTTQTVFTDTMSLNNSNLSVGAYFKNRCPEFGKILAKTDSPDRSMLPSITEVSIKSSPISSKQQLYKMDQTLDCVPVRQSRDDASNQTGGNNENSSQKESYHAAINAQQSNNLQKNELYAHNLNQPSNKLEKHEPNKVQNVDPISHMANIHKLASLTLNPMSVAHFAAHNSMAKSNMKPTDLLVRNLQSSMKFITEDTDGSMENSLSISKIADYLGKQSNVSVTDMLQFNQRKVVPKKQPLSELHTNIPGNTITADTHVTYLKDSKRTDTASSAGTLNTVISLDKSKLQDSQVPEVIVTRHSLNTSDVELIAIDDVKTRIIRSKSPSSKSHSTLSTVHENCASFKSADSPLHSSKGDANASNAPSPMIVYTELDKSVDWRDVLQMKLCNEEGLAKEQWAEITSTCANGFVGTSCPVTIQVTTLTDSWLTAKFQFDNLPDNGQDLTIELPRLPLLLSPGKSEQFTLHITSNTELNTALHYTMFFKDASIDTDIEQKGTIEVNIQMPVIQAMSSDGVNKISFPPIQEKSSLTKAFVLLSDCPVDLQLEISVVEGESIYVIKSVQEIRKSDVNKVLMERQGSTEDTQPKGRNKGNKQLCRLTSGNAIRVTITFNAPKLSDIQLTDSIATFNGILNVNLIGLNTVLRKVDLIGVVGSVNLVVQMSEEKLRLTNEPSCVTLCNNGSIPGVWIVKFRNNSPGESFPFKIAPSKFEIRPGGSKVVNLMYTGPEDCVSEGTLVFEETTCGNQTSIHIFGGSDKPKAFPIKTNHNNLSWVRAGRKELSLKNATDKRIHIRCQVIGDAFSIDLPGVESRGIYCMPFGPNECRPLPIIFAPSCGKPYVATLHLVFDKNSEFSRKVKLHGCASEGALRWSGMVTYGDTALVRAVARAPIALHLYNRASAPAFLCARIQFNLQYMSAGGARLEGARRVVGGRARAALGVAPDWPRLERAARRAPNSALATLTLLTGAELTRRRILRIIRNETTGELDTSLLPEHLKVLAEPFEGEDLAMADLLKDFKEPQASLNELISGLQELTAQIDLPQDFTDENTIIITDDTVVEHHTLCD